ncbi:MAG TPA: hypothetical protein VHU84_10510 [Lacipirellulaceae bacterium]|nr:hypothetical protein [Lacipirellulaceae bacterium]
MLASMLVVGDGGCALIAPDISHEPVIHNPFPQLSKVAVAPFFNLSDERTVDGRKFAMAYFAELQAIQGFEVVPLGVTEEAILEHHVDLSRPGEARRLANILGVDAVVIGSVTDYTPYYPPRLGLRVEWYAANPGFHEIPPGYGLPWGTPEEEYIPPPLVFESEFALAKAQLATQTPMCEKQPLDPPVLPPQPAEPAPFPGAPLPPPEATSRDKNTPPDGSPSNKNGAATKPSTKAKRRADSGQIANAHYQESATVEELPPSASTASSPAPPLQSASVAAGDTTGAIGARGPMMPPGWPDERGFIPPPPSPNRPACCPTDSPVMTHTRIYHGNDGDFTEALASYYHFRDDARFGGWQNYLERSDDFIRFCCHMHIAEMLSARGGASETRVVWSWPDCR